MKKGTRISQDTHYQVCTSCSINTPELLSRETGCLGRSMNRDKVWKRLTITSGGWGDGSVSWILAVQTSGLQLVPQHPHKRVSFAAPACQPSAGEAETGGPMRLSGSSEVWKGYGKATVAKNRSGNSVSRKALASIVFQCSDFSWNIILL